MNVALQIHQIRNKEPIQYFLQSYYHTNRQQRRNKIGTAFAMRIIGAIHKRRRNILGGRGVSNFDVASFIR
jgi:hypothetical protein